MMSKQLEERVALLEAELARLKSKVEGDSASEVPWWEKILGTFEDSPAYDEAMQLGREYRNSISSDSTISRPQIQNAIVEESIRHKRSLRSQSVEPSNE